MSGDKETVDFNNFNAQSYLTQLIADVNVMQDVQLYANFFAQFPDKSLTVIDVGGGPNVFPLIMAAEKVNRYVHADYAKNNRDEVERWKAADPQAISWKENIRRCLKVEGKSGTDEEVREREELMRSTLGAVIPCDVNSDEIVGKGYEGPYDVVNCGYCLECLYPKFEGVTKAIGRISKLVKPGGYFICTVSSISDASEKPYFYDQIPVAGFKYQGFLCAPAHMYADAFKTNGYTVISQVVHPYRHGSLDIEDVYSTIIGKKAA